MRTALKAFGAAALFAIVVLGPAMADEPSILVRLQSWR